MPVARRLPGEVTPGVVFGAMFLLHPTWSATVSTYRLRAAPDELRGRVTSISGMLSFVTRSFGYLGAGILLQAAGSTPRPGNSSPARRLPSQPAPAPAPATWRFIRRGPTCT